MDDTVDPNCPGRGQAPQTLEHWLERTRDTIRRRRSWFVPPTNNYHHHSIGGNCTRIDIECFSLEHWLDCPGTLQARLEIFSLPLKQFLCVVRTLNCSGQVGRTGKT